MSNHRSVRVLTLTLLAALILAACGAPGGATQGNAPTAAPAATTAPADAQPTTAPTDAQPTAAPADAQPTAAPAAGGGTFRVGRSATPDSLNPGAAYLSEAFDLFDLVYDSLIATDLRNRPIPRLAKEWKSSDDGKVWTFTLSEGAMWHDGQPVTAEDVAFTFTMINGFEAFALQKGYVDGLVKAEATDPTTVVLTYEDPAADWLERFSSVYILPKHIWEKFADEKAAVDFQNTEMIGSGPFKLAEFKQGEFSRLTAVKDHYATPPLIDGVIFTVYQNDDALVQALKAGEIDGMGVSPSLVRALKTDPNIAVEIGNQLSLSDIIFNVTTKENCPTEGGVCSGHPALKDVKVRQALAHATDKQQLIDVMLLGLGTPGISLTMPGHGEGFNSSLTDYAFDVVMANKILDDAGYADSDGDGIREMPGDPSKPLNLRFSWPADQLTEGARFSELLRDMWKQVGVELTPQGLEADALTSICCPAFDFDVILWGWGAGADPASLLYILTTDQIPTGTSETGYSNPEYDTLFQQQRGTADPAARKEILWKMQEIALRDSPYIIPYYPQAVIAYRKDRVSGLEIDPEGLLSLASRNQMIKVSLTNP